MTLFDQSIIVARLITIKETIDNMLYAAKNDGSFPMTSDVADIDNVIYAAGKLKEKVEENIK